MDTLREYVVSYFASLEQAAQRLVHGAADATVLPLVHTLGQRPLIVVVVIAVVIVAAKAR